MREELGLFGPVGYASQDILAGKLWIPFEYLLHCHARREQVQDQGHLDPMPPDAGFAEANVGI
jgi:hypothetical protein